MPAWVQRLHSAWLNWWLDQDFRERWYVLGVALATIFGASYRLVNLRDSMQFLADQGRDAITAFTILQGHVTLIGPQTSVGDMFLGPLYYYFMAVFLWLFHYDPIGPAVVVALIGVITIPLLFWLGRRLIGSTPAFLATLLYATAPTVIAYTRFSWNPNPAPIVTLAFLYCVYKAWHGSARWWLGAVLSWCVIIQLHYVAGLLAVPLGVFWLADFVRSWRNDQARIQSLLVTVPVSIGIFVFSIVPLIIFDFRYNHLIWNGFMKFFTDKDPNEGVKAVNFVSILKEHHGRAMQVFFEIWGKEWTRWYRQINTGLLAVFVAVLLLGWQKFRKSEYHFGYLLLVVTGLSAITGLAFYRSSVFLHYLTFIYPVSYLLTGLVLTLLPRLFKKVGLVLAVGIFVYANWLQTTPANLDYMRSLGWTITDMQKVSEQVYQSVPLNKSYFLSALTEVRDYRGMNYRYFLVTSPHPPVALDQFGKADELVVIAENPRDEENVLGSPVYEIQTFPKGEFTTQETAGPLLYFVQRKNP